MFLLQGADAVDVGSPICAGQTAMESTWDLHVDGGKQPPLCGVCGNRRLPRPIIAYDLLLHQGVPGHEEVQDGTGSSSSW